MEITQQAKLELNQIYYSQTGEVLTDQQVEEMAQDLFCLFDAIYRPLPERDKLSSTQSGK